MKFFYSMNHVLSVQGSRFKVRGSATANLHAPSSIFVMLVIPTRINKLGCGFAALCPSRLCGFSAHAPTA
jgi:hypothetical protein